MFGFSRAQDRTDEILQKYLDEDFSCFAAFDQAPTRARLKQVARKYGCEFPEDFVAHSTGEFGGIYAEVKEEVWPRPKEFDVAPFWTFLYAVYVYGLAADIPEWMNMDLAAAEFKKQTGHSLVPCLKIVGDPDIYLFDRDARIVRWNHEEDELEPFEGSFFDLLEHEIRRLRERKDRKVAS